LNDDLILNIVRWLEMQADMMMFIQQFCCRRWHAFSFILFL